MNLNRLFNSSIGLGKLSSNTYVLSFRKNWSNSWRIVRPSRPSTCAFVAAQKQKHIYGFAPLNGIKTFLLRRENARRPSLIFVDSSRLPPRFYRQKKLNLHFSRRRPSVGRHSAATRCFARGE